MRLSPSGLLRVSAATDSHRVRVMLPVMHGGQAAVAKAVPEGQEGPALALRVQAVSSEQEKARQMERLVAMLTVAEAARNDPATYPAVLPVLESFVVTVPGHEVTGTRAVADHELWCDVMTWCPQNLQGYHRETGEVAREPRAVTAALLPVLATVRAVHDNLSIVHRDITPNNVLVDEAGRLLLADWGIAHAVAADRTSTHTQMIGNRGFSLPPEMLAGDTAVGRYTDAWYLGSLLVWMLTGGPPGPHGELPPLPSGPEGERLAALARGLCWPDPRHRMSLPQAVDNLTQPVPTGWTAPLDSAATAPFAAPAATVPWSPGPAGTGVPVPGQPPPARRHRVLRIVLASVAVVALAVTAGVLWQVRNDRTEASSSDPASTRPAPNPTYTFEPDQPTYPPFTGVNTALTAFPLLSDDLPECRQLDPASYVPAGARELYECAWSDLDATVYLSRWATGFQGAEAFRDSIGPDATERSWGMGTDDVDHERGPRFAWGRDPQHHVICYRDLPYCMETVSPDDDVRAEVYDRVGAVDTSDAATFVARWPDVHPEIALPEP